MQRVQGSKNADFFTKNDKLIAGVYISATIVCTAIFVVTLVQMLQLKDVLQKKSGDTSIHSATRQSSSSDEVNKTQSQIQKEDFQDQINNLKLKLTQWEKSASSKARELEANLTQCKADAERASRKFEALETRLVFIAAGFIKLSNGLYFNHFYNRDGVTYQTAKESCKGMNARLVSASVRNSTTRREIHRKIGNIARYMWIGLERSNSWVWLDGKVYNERDFSLQNRYYGHAGAILINSLYSSAFSVSSRLYYYICEAGF